MQALVPSCRVSLGRASPRLLGPVFAAALFFAFALAAKGVIFAWSDITWPDDSLTNTYDFDPSNAGDDIRITISGSTGGLISPSPNVYPIGNTFAFTGGISASATAASQNLDLFVNHGSNADFLTVTVEFLYPTGVMDVAYTFFDIDSSNGSSGGGTIDYRDQIRSIVGFNSLTTTTVYDPSITIINSSFVDQTGSGPTLSVQGLNSTSASATDNTDEGSVDFDWGTDILTQLSWDYGNATNTTANPAQQGIGLHDISFTVAPVPEPTAALLILLSSFLLLERRRSRVGGAF